MSKPKLLITDNVQIGNDNSVFIIAEVGLCHDGDPLVAKELIRRCYDAGADAVKFQKRDVTNLATFATLNKLDNRYPLFGKTYREIREHVELDLDTYYKLKSYADELGIMFFASVFDKLSADQMFELGCPLIKLASHVLTNKPLIKHICRIGLPTLLSTGMAYLEEIDETVALLKDSDVPLGLFHCVSSYPHSAEDANLNMINFLRDRYNVPVGYSCHEKGDTSSLLSVAAGAQMIERHVTLDNNRQGFDHHFALDMNRFAEFVAEVRRIETIMGTIDKTVSDKEWETRRKYHFSVISRAKITKGTVITEDMLIVKNPGIGIPAREIDNVINRKAAVNISEDQMITYDMLV